MKEACQTFQEWEDQCYLSANDDKTMYFIVQTNESNYVLCPNLVIDPDDWPTLGLSLNFVMLNDTWSR